MNGELIFLGTGTSMGVPTLGCGCVVCTSDDPRDRRLRPSVLLRWPEGGRERVVVIDTGPDFREQAVREGIRAGAVEPVLLRSVSRALFGRWVRQADVRWRTLCRPPLPDAKARMHHLVGSAPRPWRPEASDRHV